MIRTVCMVLAVVVLGSGCAAAKPQSAPAARADTPQEAVTMAFDALRVADAAVFDALAIYEKTRDNGVVRETPRFFGSSLDEEGREYVLAAFEELDYKVVSLGEEEGWQGPVTVDITNKDLSQLDPARFADAENPLAEAVRAVTGTVSSRVDVQVTQTDDGWKVIVDDALYRALWGNKETVLDSLGRLLP